MSINAISGSVRNLENAVYYIDSKGRYASLPANNSMRIDLLASRLSWLIGEVESAIGTDNTGKFNKVTDYLEKYDEEGSHIETFPTKTYDNHGVTELIDRSTTSHEEDFTNVQGILQTLYDSSKVIIDRTTGIVVDDKDGYLVPYDDSNTSYITHDIVMSKDDLQTIMGKYPDAFPYIYQTMRYIYDRVMYLQNHMNVFENMDNSILQD